jgi:hypothetical protein
VVVFLFCKRKVVVFDKFSTKSGGFMLLTPSELYAMEEAFNLAADLGVIRAEFETDSRLLALAPSSRTPDFSTEAAVIEDLKLQSLIFFVLLQVYQAFQ